MLMVEHKHADKNYTKGERKHFQGLPECTINNGPSPKIII